MNTKKHMIIVKGEIKTPEIKFCHYNAQTQKMDITYQSGISGRASYRLSNLASIRSKPKMSLPIFGRLRA